MAPLGAVTSGQFSRLAFPKHLGNAQLDCGGCTLHPELHHARRCSEIGLTVTYFRGVLRTSVTMAMRLQANIMGFLVKVFAFNHSQKLHSCTKVLGALKEMSLNNSNDMKGLNHPRVSDIRAAMATWVSSGEPECSWQGSSLPLGPQRDPSVPAGSQCWQADCSPSLG